MAPIVPMPAVAIAPADLQRFGARWALNGNALSRTPPESSNQLGQLFNDAVGGALAAMLGGLAVNKPSGKALMPSNANCVEVGEVRIIGGVRPQNFDVGYRPDGVRFVLDSKTLNDRESIGKNWQNMINDLATEATTVHSRFPHAVVAFMVIYPAPCVSFAHQKATVETLERLARRNTVDGPFYMAEAISLVLWHPSSGTIDTDIPASSSPLRIEKFSEQVETAYVSRYKGLPPHTD